MILLPLLAVFFLACSGILTVRALKSVSKPLTRPAGENAINVVTALRVESQLVAAKSMMNRLPWLDQLICLKSCWICFPIPKCGSATGDAAALPTALETGSVRAESGALAAASGQVNWRVLYR